MATAILRILP